MTDGWDDEVQWSDLHLRPHRQAERTEGNMTKPVPCPWCNDESHWAKHKQDCPFVILGPTALRQKFPPHPSEQPTDTASEQPIFACTDTEVHWHIVSGRKVRHVPAEPPTQPTDTASLVAELSNLTPFNAVDQQVLDRAADLIEQQQAERDNLRAALVELVPLLRGSVYSCARQAHVDMVRIAEAALARGKDDATD